MHIKTGSCQIRQLPVSLHTNTLKYFLQCIFTAGVAPYHIGITSLCFIYCTSDHFMRNSICKEHDQIWIANLLAEICRHLCKYFCLAIKALADLLVLTHHPVMTTYDNNAHIKPPNSRNVNYQKAAIHSHSLTR